MSAERIRGWAFVHKWSSLVCTLFLLFLCVTGLPLIFHDEIDALGDNHVIAGPPSARSGLPLDGLVARALADYRMAAGQSGVPLFIGFSSDDPTLTVTVGPRADASAAQMRLFSYDRTSGQAVGEVRGEGLMDLVLKLHTDMLLGLPGMLFLGVMGLLFVVAIVTGLVIYVPFMRRLAFGTVRQDRSPRVARLDEHNLLGAVTLGWALVIGLTGAINAFADPLTALWRQGELSAMVADYRALPPLAPAHYASIDRSLAAAQEAESGLAPQFIGFPGGAWSSPHHYAVFFQGDTALTAHILSPALVDAATGRLTRTATMPWSMQALMLSRPLHFGDYGGLALKLVWAMLDLATIRVLWTGLWLWWTRRERRA